MVRFRPFPSGAGSSFAGVQRSLFDRTPIVDRSRDPYAHAKAAGKRLAERFGVSEASAVDAVLVFGSEEAAAKELHKLWLLGELDEAA